MKKGLRKSISSIVAAIMLSGSFIFAPIDIPEIGLKDFRFSRDPAAPQVLTYDESTGKYLVDGVEANNNKFPTSGDYVLGSDVPLSNKFSVIGSLSIDLNGYDIVDKYSGTGDSLITIKNATFTLSDSTFSLENEAGGSLIADVTSNVSGKHRAFFIQDGGVLNISSGYVEGFALSVSGSADGGGAVSMEKNKNAVFNFSGGVIRNCSSNASTGGGAVNVLGGTFTMSGYSMITDCHNTFGTVADKQGNGAGVQVGNSAKMYLKDHASITYCTGKGRHGAGIDLWGSGDCSLTISGSPKVENNTGGRGYACNLYCGKAINIGDIELIRDDQNNIVSHVGITIQQTPVFTIGASANNEEPLEDLAQFFFADREYANDVPNPQDYDIEPHDNTELKQIPTIMVYFYRPTRSQEVEWTFVRKLECVPMGYIKNLNGSGKYGDNSALGWSKNQDSFEADFKGDTTTGYSDFNLYEVVVPQVKGFSLCSFDDGSMGLKGYVTYSNNADLGFVDSDATVEVSQFTSNPNDPSIFNLDTSEIVTLNNKPYVTFTFKFNPYDMAKDLKYVVSFSNGFSIDKTVKPSDIGKAIVNAKNAFGSYGTTEAKQLASSVLIYGACLQTQLGYYLNKSNDLATKDTGSNLMTHGAITSTGTSTEKSVDVGETALTYYGSSVVYNSNIQIKHYIKLNGESASDYTYSIDGEGDYTLELDGSGKYMYAKINVPAYMMDHSYTVTIKSGSDTVVTINYSVYNYIDSILNNSAKQGQPVYSTVQALYWYCEDAKAYASV